MADAANMMPGWRFREIAHDAREQAGVAESFLRDIQNRFGADPWDRKEEPDHLRDLSSGQILQYAIRSLQQRLELANVMLDQLDDGRTID